MKDNNFYTEIEKTGVQPTRQASKWRNKKGAAYQVFSANNYFV